MAAPASSGGDALTGLQTRPALEAALGCAVATEPAGIALAVLDVDYFMQINEQFGSAAGDRVLQTLARLLEAEAPGAAFRLSGDEFALLLPGLGLEQAFLRMEHLRARAAETLQTCLDAAGLVSSRPPSVTLGVAQFPRDARDAPGLIRAAEAALEAAKENGRNTVGLPLAEEMVMKSCYYPAASVRKLKVLAERMGQKESHLLREALGDLLRKYDTAPAARSGGAA